MRAATSAFFTDKATPPKSSSTAGSALEALETVKAQLDALHENDVPW